jgi:hypothetical protein
VTAGARRGRLNANLSTADQVGLRSRAVVGPSDTVISLPAPGGGMQRFAILESSIMEAGLAAAHPEIKTYAGVGIDDPTARLRADTTPLGFHASVRAITATKARIKIEAIGNVFFDVSHADVAIIGPPTVPVGGTVPPTLSVVLGAPPACSRP